MLKSTTAAVALVLMASLTGGAQAGDEHSHGWRFARQHHDRSSGLHFGSRDGHRWDSRHAGGHDQWSRSRSHDTQGYRQHLGHSRGNHAQ